MALHKPNTVFMRICNMKLFPVLILILAACTREATMDESPPPPPPSVSVRSYLALGDSYTIGQGVSEAGRFPAQTRDMLNAMGIPMTEPRIIARTGWTTTDLKEAIAQQAPPSTFDLVTLLIGVNDQYRWRDTTGYRSRFRELLQTAITLAGNRTGRVVVLSIPDYSVTPFAQNMDTATIRRQIDWFNNINRDVTNTAGVAYLDITPSTREARNNPSLIAPDGLHPSGLEYRKWANQLATLIRPAL